jgi:hypothetical protein
LLVRPGDRYDPSVTGRFLLALGARRELRAALGVYALTTLVYLVFCRAELLGAHTPFNHFALQAEAWLAGRVDLPAGAPAYAGSNDFAVFEGRTYVVFPAFPALILLPFVAALGGARHVPDGLVFVLIAGLSPAILLLALERLRELGRSALSLGEHTALALSFAFGSVFFFTAVEGSVWYAAHVVSAVLASLYLWSSLGAARPLVSGVALALAFATRAPLIFAFPLFVVEAFRAAAPADAACVFERPRAFARSLDRRKLSASLAWFALPLVITLGIVLAHNHARFGDPFEFGYRYLAIRWQARIERWGLFDYHYLARNLGVVLSGLPFVPGSNGSAFQINHHGLALWLTTPLYLGLFRLKGRLRAHGGLIATAVLVALPSLFYQNTGWIQFGYRFSNDYAPFLFALLAVAGLRLRGGWAVLAASALAINAFGAWTFGRAEYRRFYFTDPTQTVIYQPD